MMMKKMAFLNDIIYGILLKLKQNATDLKNKTKEHLDDQKRKSSSNMHFRLYLFSSTPDCVRSVQIIIEHTKVTEKNKILKNDEKKTKVH